MNGKRLVVMIFWLGFHEILTLTKSIGTEYMTGLCRLQALFDFKSIRLKLSK